MISAAPFCPISAGFHYITAITKPQIRAMIKKEVFQLGLFDQNLCEVEHNGVRYILQRNPQRAREMADSRASRIAALQKLAAEQSRYLAEHPRSKIKVDTKKKLQTCRKHI